MTKYTKAIIPSKMPPNANETNVNSVRNWTNCFFCNHIIVGDYNETMSAGKLRPICIKCINEKRIDYEKEHDYSNDK